MNPFAVMEYGLIKIGIDTDNISYFEGVEIMEIHTRQLEEEERQTEKLINDSKNKKVK